MVQVISSRLIFNAERKPKPLASFPLCTADEKLEYVDTDGPVLCWDSLGLPDLDCDEKPAWISSSSLAGELIQPGPQEVWAKLPTPDTHTDGQTVLQHEGESIGSRLEKGWRRDGDGTITEEGRKRTSDQSETLRVTVTRRYGAEMADMGKESNYKRLMLKSAGENNQRKCLSDTETVSQWREDSFKRWKKKPRTL